MITILLFPFKLPLIPIKSLLELNQAPSPLYHYVEDTRDIAWLMNQIDMFALTTFHFVMVCIYAGLIVGIVTGINLRLIALFLTLDSKNEEEREESIWPSEGKREQWGSKEEKEGAVAQQQEEELEDDFYAALEKKEKFTLLEELKRKEKEQLQRIKKLRHEESGLRKRFSGNSHSGSGSGSGNYGSDKVKNVKVKQEPGMDRDDIIAAVTGSSITAVDDNDNDDDNVYDK